MPPVEQAVRTGTAAVLLLTGVIMLRDRRRLESGPFGGLLCLSVAADVVASVAGPGAQGWTWPLRLVAMGGPAMFWIWAGAAFVDDFRPGWREALAWLLLPALRAVGMVAWQPWMATAMQAVSGLFILLAAWRIGANVRDDLVERRRRLRPALAILSVLYSVGVLALTAIGPGSGAAAGWTVEAVALAALSVSFALLALRAGPPLATPAPVAPVALPTPVADDQDEALLARLRAVMEDKKAYRQEGFGVATLVEALGVPEYRVRRLINQRLGHRNFPSFVNGYRLTEAKAALADPGQAAVPILTIAMDAGFHSIGPFNRAFKAATGMTPSEYRQAETRKTGPI
jgi:AraC-like DNA-binding protein